MRKRWSWAIGLALAAGCTRLPTGGTSSGLATASPEPSPFAPPGTNPPAVGPLPAPVVPTLAPPPMPPVPPTPMPSEPPATTASPSPAASMPPGAIGPYVLHIDPPPATP